MNEVSKILKRCRGEDLPACQVACPAHVNAKGYIAKIADGDFKGAIETVREAMPFAGVCGRVCSHPCESECERSRVDEPVAIRALKRFVADYEMHHGREKATPVEQTREEQVAIIGSGPAGLTCAYHLVKAGYETTVFEALPKTGGRLRYRIPAHRLPDEALDHDIYYVKELGVEIKTNRPVKNLEGIFDQGYRAIFLAIGAWTFGKSRIAREDAEEVHILELLEPFNLGKAVRFVDPVSLKTNRDGVFAGGDMVSGPATVIEAVAAGREAAISIDRYLKGEDLSEGRPVEIKRLKGVSTEGIEKKGRAVIPMLDVSKGKHLVKVEQSLDEKSAIEEAKRCLSCECRLCMTDCEFLSRFCKSPKGFSRDFLAGAFKKKPQALFCCSLCDLCEKICPEDINVGHMCMEARRVAVDEGSAPLAGHRLVLKDQAFVRSDDFTLMVPNSEKREVRRVFFPGCHLSAYRPSLVTSAYEWLRNKDPDTGILLRCCGAPSNGLGFLSDFKEMVSDLEDAVEQMGAEEIISACPNCFRTLSRYSDRLNPVSLYDVMAVEWDEGDIHTAEDGVFNLHDPCAGRFHPHAQDNVRTLVKYTGARIEELAHKREDTRCCGMGGMIAFTSPELAGTLSKRRVAETTQDLLTYCATCQGSFAGQKPTLHILDILFNPNWRQDKNLPPNKPLVNKENQRSLKKMLEERYSEDF